MDLEEPIPKNKVTTTKSKLYTNKQVSKGIHSSSSPDRRHHHPFNILYRLVVICGSIYCLHEMEVFHQIMRGPLVNHTWFKIGLAASVAISFIKAYMELYEGKLKKTKVEYLHFKNATHMVLLLFIIASFAFHKALWVEYGGLKTLFINFLLGYGVLLQCAFLLPIWLQNLITIIGFTFFIQQYH